jgi:hypothetical protein
MWGGRRRIFAEWTDKVPQTIPCLKFETWGIPKQFLISSLVWSRQSSSLLQLRAGRSRSIAGEGFVGRGGDGDLHEIGPERQRDGGSRLFITEGLAIVETDPDAARDRR